jgi:predicted RNA-binding protein with PUA-like domain
MPAKAAWLLKSEPDAFSIDNLLALPQKTTLWDGVRNYQARNNLQLMQVGDRAFFYHSSCAVPAIVGEMKVVAVAIPDVTAFDPGSKYFDSKSTPEKPKWFSPKLKGTRKYVKILTRDQLGVTVLKNSLLFRNSRLSVIPLTAAEVKVLDKLLAVGETA